MIAALALALLASPAAAPVPEAIGFAAVVERALAAHPALRVAEQDVARAMALVEQARAPSLPQLAGNGAYTLLDADRRRGDLLVAAQQQISGSAQLVLPLLAPTRWAQWWRMSHLADAQRADADDVRREVALGAARAWLSVLGQRRLLAAAARAKDAAQAHLDFAAQRLAGGVGNRLDEVRAGQELAVSQAQLEGARAELVRLQEALGVAAGADGPLDAAPHEPELAAPAALAQAIESASTRLDVRAAQARQDATEAATRADFTDYLPLLTAVGEGFVQDPPSITRPVVGWQVQALLTLPLYDGGLRYGLQKERRAVAAAAAAQAEAVLRQARSEVRAAFAAVRHRDDALLAARDAATAAAIALELASALYAAGGSTNLDVIDAERRARDAESQAAVAEDAALQARLDLLAASGRFP